MHNHLLHFLNSKLNQAQQEVFSGLLFFAWKFGNSNGFTIIVNMS